MWISRHGGTEDTERKGSVGPDVTTFGSRRPYRRDKMLSERLRSHRRNCAKPCGRRVPQRGGRRFLRAKRLSPLRGLMRFVLLTQGCGPPESGPCPGLYSCRPSGALTAKIFFLALDARLSSASPHPHPHPHALRACRPLPRRGETNSRVLLGCIRSADSKQQAFRSWRLCALA